MMTLRTVHLALTNYPADPRVRRAAQAAPRWLQPVAVVALRLPGQRPVTRVAGVLVIRLPGRKARAGFISYLRDYIGFALRSRVLLARHRRFRGIRVVHVHTLPDFLVWSALPLRRRGAKIVLDLHEIFPEFAATKFPGIGGRLLAFAATSIERWSRAHADATITVNHPIARLLHRRAPANAGPQIVVHNTPDPTEFGPLRRPVITAATSVHCVYHGTLTSLYGLDIAIRGVAASRRSGIDARLTIIGDGPDRPSLLSLVRDLRVEDGVTFREPQPPSWLRDALPTFDAGIVPTKLDDMTRFSLSNKLLEYVHLGVPLLAARLPSYTEYFAETAAWFWTPNDSEALAEALATFARTTPGERAARALEAQEDMKDFDWGRERERLATLYSTIIERSEPVP